MSTSGPIAMRRHPDRTSILSEAHYSKDMAKYYHEDLVSQALAYLAEGLTDNHLWHCALIVRYQSSAVMNFDTQWWLEMSKSLKDQISAPYAEYISSLRINPIPKYLNWFNIFSFHNAHRDHEYRSVFNRSDP